MKQNKSKRIDEIKSSYHFPSPREETEQTLKLFTQIDKISRHPHERARGARDRYLQGFSPTTLLTAHRMMPVVSRDKPMNVAPNVATTMFKLITPVSP